MADLVGGGFLASAEAHKLYARHDLLLVYKDVQLSHLDGGWRDLFNATSDAAAAI